MRTHITIVFVLLCVALITCAIIAYRSKKSISNDVAFLLITLIPPVVGNSLIIISGDWFISNIGCYLYYIGMDLIVMALLQFTVNYCGIYKKMGVWRWILGLIVMVDIGQLMLNPITGMAFTTHEIYVDGMPYYQLVPLAGQVFHRIVAYGIFLTSLVIFIVKCARAPRVYVERYLVIVLAMLVGGLWQSYYIFSGTPVDRSMVGFGVFGLLVFYFSLYYKPFRLLDRMLSRVVSGLNSAVFFFETNGTCIYANKRACDLIGIPVDRDIPENATALAHDAIGGWGQHELDSDWSDMRQLERNGETRFFEVRVQQVRDERNRHVGASLTVRDATEEKLSLQREKHLATHDRLTGLYNKEYLYEKAQRAINEHPDTKYLAVAMDVRDFKMINDVFSNEFGDKVLCWIADWMRHFAAIGAVYGRLSGDKFGFIAPASAFDAAAVESRLRERIFHDDETGVEHPIILHLGVYEVGSEDVPLDIMFDRAFMAISTIKNDYQHHIAYYDKTMREEVLWRQKLSNELGEAIAQGQIKPYLQPMVNASGDVEGAEVLVRWIHPEEGFLPPARFIPVFEANGMIARLDMYMWECACRILKEWEKRGIDLFLSVNISPKDFYFIDVFDTICELVKRFDVDTSKLRLEITETVMMSDVENRLKVIEDLRDQGFLVEMDDFGSGYSSLNMLKDIPVDVLKIDMMFLYKTKDQNKAHTILQTIIDLSGQLGIPSVTEGVETVEQLTMLTDMGCHLFQGYYFAKPMPRDEFEETYCCAA